MSQYADLEIGFRKRDERSYALSFRFSSPDDEVDHPALIRAGDYSRQLRVEGRRHKGLFRRIDGGILHPGGTGGVRQVPRYRAAEVVHP